MMVQTSQWNTIERKDINLHKYRQLSLTKDQGNTMEQRMSFQQMMLEKLKSGHRLNTISNH